MWVHVSIVLISVSVAVGQGPTGCLWDCVKDYVPIGYDAAHFLSGSMANENACDKLKSVNECADKCEPNKVQKYTLWVLQQWQKKYCDGGSHGADEFYQKMMGCSKAVKDKLTPIDEKCQYYPPISTDDLCKMVNECVIPVVNELKSSACGEPAFSASQNILEIAYGVVKDSLYPDQPDPEQCSHYDEIPGLL
ncbi:hypothetical protein DdX_11045 [Ditylenchus destructor]|uniref:Secreted protein n=1 Tax=Ditylenchus destructor TaxID=166010 RepID=A0AAD4N301_9BILA|nr:hypothetical protein DdX_11045 [Ditylenchus destructor]